MPYGKILNEKVPNTVKNKQKDLDYLIYHGMGITVNMTYTARNTELPKRYSRDRIQIRTLRIGDSGDQVISYNHKILQ